MESRPVLTLLLLKLVCCGILLLLIFALGGTGIAGWFLKDYGIIVLIGVSMALGGYWLWRRIKWKGS